MTLYRHEMKMNLKSLFIWTLCVGGMCFGCILLYTSLEDSIQGMADAYSNMGAMSAALGMDKMSLATLRGFYATEITMMHGLGGAMFAAVLGISLLSKEESGHTSEFLNVLPIGRVKIFFQKYLALFCNIILFNLICAAFYLLGFWFMEEQMIFKEFCLYHLAATLMHIEIATVCFMLSAFIRRSLPGAALGLTLLLFAADMMCRIIPAIKNLKYLTPFYYASAADIFTDTKVNLPCCIIAATVILITLFIALVHYKTKDLTP